MVGAFRIRALRARAGASVRRGKTDAVRGVHEDGFPELVWSREPENKELLNLQKAAALNKGISETLMQASTYVQGMGAIGGLIGAAIFKGKGSTPVEAASPIAPQIVEPGPVMPEPVQPELPETPESMETEPPAERPPA